MMNKVHHEIVFSFIIIFIIQITNCFIKIQLLEYYLNQYILAQIREFNYTNDEYYLIYSS